MYGGMAVIDGAYRRSGYGLGYIGVFKLHNANAAVSLV